MNPPAGGTATWWYHEVVKIGDRVYDAMTGPGGMAFEEYKKLFVDAGGEFDKYFSLIPR